MTTPHGSSSTTFGICGSVGRAEASGDEESAPLKSPGDWESVPRKGEEASASCLFGGSLSSSSLSEREPTAYMFWLFRILL